MNVYHLSKNRLYFPSPDQAIKEGLLAIGGDLSIERLLLSYSMGIFPWYSEGEPILWWTPDPRLVLFPDELKISKSLRKIIRQKKYHITIDKAFEDVIKNCAFIRDETWIVNEMIEAYIKLHRAGFAHSFECWQADELVGGLYGVSLGRSFFGESMFSKKNNTSKIAMVSLVDFIKLHNFDMIDCQTPTNHLKSLGAKEISRKNFLDILKKSLKKKTIIGKWSNL